MLLVGRVTKFPSKASNLFVITWEHQQQSLPAAWTQSHIEATKENKELLKLAVQLHQQKNPHPSKRGRPNISVGGTQVQNNVDSTIPETPPQVMRARHAAVACLRTCASVGGGTISSLTNGTSGTGSTQQGSTRSRNSRHDSDPNVVSTVEDSDSDDGDDVDEQDSSWCTLAPHLRDDDDLPCDQFN